MAQPEVNPDRTQPAPAQPAPDEGQTLQPNKDVEVNPSKPANDTEVDLDTNKTKTYPDQKPQRQ